MFEIMYSMIKDMYPLSIDELEDGKFKRTLFTIEDATIDECKKICDILNNLQER